MNTNLPASDYIQWSRQRLLEQGTHCLRYGTHLENAISYFSELAKREPQNARWKTLLACAQAQRAYTITRAMEDAKEYKTPEEHYKYWQDLRKKIFSLEKTPIPPPPPIPRTRDDNRLFTQKPEVAAAQITQLSLGAIDLLEKSTQLAAKESPEVQAELAHLKGWALLVLWNAPRCSVPSSWPAKDGKPEGPDRIVDALEQAVKIQPENSSYLQSLSDGCILASADPVGSPMVFPRRFDEMLFNRGRDVLREFIQKRPRRAEYWFRLGSVDTKGDFSALASKLYPDSPFNNSAPPTAITPVADDHILSLEGVSAFKRAAAMDTANPLYQYILAVLRLGEGDQEGMIEAMERGNAAGPLMPVRYPYAIPSTFAWMFSELDQIGVSSVHYLCKGVSDMQHDKDALETKSRFRRGIAALKGMDNKFREAMANPVLSTRDKDVFLSNEMSLRSALLFYSPSK